MVEGEKEQMKLKRSIERATTSVHVEHVDVFFAASIRDSFVPRPPVPASKPGVHGLRLVLEQYHVPCADGGRVYTRARVLGLAVGEDQIPTSSRNNLAHDG